LKWPNGVIVTSENVEKLLNSERYLHDVLFPKFLIRPTIPGSTATMASPPQRGVRQLCCRKGMHASVIHSRIALMHAKGCSETAIGTNGQRHTRPPHPRSALRQATSNARGKTLNVSTPLSSGIGNVRSGRLTLGISRAPTRTVNGGPGCMPWLADIKAALKS
jgi:hypothetical protein